VDLQARIRALKLELDGLDRRLTADPTSAGSVAEVLADLGERNPLTSFREALPFPLASILWRYEADADMGDKIGHLFRFFEASAIFFATVLLSAFVRDDELYNREKRRWFKTMRRNSFDSSNFGTWTLFGHKMASSARTTLGDADERGRMLAGFSVGSEGFAETVARAELWEVLDEAKNARNDEKAHGGIAGPAQYEATHARLAALLTKLGELLGPYLGGVMLVRPGAGRKRRGVVQYDRAELLQGPQGIFRQVSVATSESGGLEDSELYLLSPSENPAPTALRLEPFVRLKHSPPDAQNACYFYAKVNGDEVEFVSHHFEGRPRITEPDAEVVELIAALQAEEEGNGGKGPVAGTSPLSRKHSVGGAWCTHASADLLRTSVSCCRHSRGGVYEEVWSCRCSARGLGPQRRGRSAHSPAADAPRQAWTRPELGDPPRSPWPLRFGRTKGERGSLHRWTPPAD
jgi:hypothetical protein